MKTTTTQIAFVFLFFFSYLSVQAQLNYLPAGFSTSLGSYTDIDLLGTPISVANTDDAFSSTIPIGFTFNFNGAPYDSFVFSTNGFIKLGSIAPSRQFLFTTFLQPPANGPFTAATSPTPLASDSSMLFAFGQDLIADSLTNHFSYYLDGTFGSRVCTIQWRRVKDKLQNATVGLYDSLDFQIKLYEGTNIIEYVYGPWYTTIIAAAVRYSAVGIVGNSMTVANQNMHLVKGSTVAWGSSVATTGFYLNNAVNYRNSISSPAGPGPENGRSFTFVPLAVNDAAVNVIYAQGKIALPFYQAEPITANVSNPGINTLTSLLVTLDITGANSYTTSVTIPSLAPGTNVNVTFPAYTPLVTGASLITVSVPFDDNNLNNQKQYSMSVNNTNMAYFDTLSPVSGSNGITIPNFWGCKYFISGRAVIKQVKAFLVINADATGDTVCGLIMDTTGKVIARSPNHIVLAGDAGTTMVFNIPVPPYIQNQTIISGIAGGTSVNGLNYFLGASQTEIPIRSPNPFYFLTQTTGTGLTNVKVGDVWAVPGLTGTQTTRLMMETVVDKVPDIDIHIANASPLNGLKIPTGVNVPLRAYIKNLGLLATTDSIAVRYSINGGAAIGPKYYTSSIAMNDTASVVFSGLQALQFATPGMYQIKIYSTILNDGIPGNDTFLINYEAVAPTSLPYRIDDGIFTNWTIQNTTSSVLLSSATAVQANGVSSSAVLKANNIGTVVNAEARALSPIFNFSSVAHPMLHFNVSHTPNTFVGTDDTLQVEVSLDGGVTFTPVYTRSSQLSIPTLGTAAATSLAFTPSSSGQWRYEAVDLTAYAGNPFVLLSFRFKSQGGNNAYIGNVMVSSPSNTSVQPVFSPGSYVQGNATMLFVNIGASAGEVTFGQYGNAPFSNASPVYATNSVATTNNFSIFTPNNVSDNSWYAISYSGIGTGNPDTTVSYYLFYEKTGVNGILSLDSLYLMRRNNYSSPWVALSTTVTGTTLSAGPVFGFGDFSIGSVSSVNPLPVKWLNISAQSIHSLSNRIGWATASESQTSYFVVERSLDGKRYTEIGRVNAANHSGTTKWYHVTDGLDEPMKSSFYYRIKQVNDNGTFEYSKVVVLQPVERNSEVTAANPFIDYPTLNIQNEEQAQVASIEFIDITGKVIFDQTVTLSYGKNLLAFRELGYLKHGVYFMKVSIGQSEPIVKKIIKSSSN
jgi:hypothetical protein